MGVLDHHTLRYFRFTLRTLLLAVLVCSAVLAGYHWLRSRVVVENLSSQPLQHVIVEVCGQRLRFDSVGSGSSVAAPFSITGDGDFYVTVEFADGTKITNSGGYVTNGMLSVRADILVYDSAIEINQR